MNENNTYKATFILDTRNYKEPVETLMDKLKNVIEGLKGVVKEIENIGQQSFARVTNKKFPQAMYVQIYFEGPRNTPEAIKKKLHLDKTIYRTFIETIM